jgi:hypothetical protein
MPEFVNRLDGFSFDRAAKRLNFQGEELQDFDLQGGGSRPPA